MDKAAEVKKVEQEDFLRLCGRIGSLMRGGSREVVSLELLIESVPADAQSLGHFFLVPAAHLHGFMQQLCLMLYHGGRPG